MKATTDPTLARIQAEYTALKAKPTAELRQTFRAQHRVVSDCKDLSKASLIAGILCNRHGAKRFQAALA